MKRNVLVIIIVAILAIISICEELTVREVTTNLGSYTSALESAINQNEDNIDVTEVNDSFEKLNDYWNSKKTHICFFANYDKIKYMDENMIKLDDAIKDNDNILAKENLSSVKSFGALIQYVMGFNINNLF